MPAGQPGRTGRAESLWPLARPALPPELGDLRQASVCQRSTNISLPRPLLAPRGYRQFAAGLLGGRSGLFSLEGLRRRAPGRNVDTKLARCRQLLGEPAEPPPTWVPALKTGAEWVLQWTGGGRCGCCA